MSRSTQQMRNRPREPVKLPDHDRVELPAVTEDVSELLRARVARAKRQFVFPAKSDIEKPIGSVRKTHDAAVENAKIKEHFRLYDMRHTFATRAVAAGVDLPTLSAILGHTSIQMTMRYIHPAEEQEKIAVGKLEQFRIAGILQAVESSRRVPTMRRMN